MNYECPSFTSFPEGKNVGIWGETSPKTSGLLSDPALLYKNLKNINLNKCALHDWIALLKQIVEILLFFTINETSALINIVNAH